MLTNIKLSIKRTASILLASCCLVSCNYLDVIPPATPDFDDTMKDVDLTLDFLYTCYGGVPRSEPFYFKAYERGNDENAFPPGYAFFAQRIQWGTASPSSQAGVPSCNTDYNIWTPSYNFLGYTHEFMNQLKKSEPANLSSEDRDLFMHEAMFLEAYYQMRVLQAYGPIAIIDGKVDPGITTDELPGRSHFDYCVDYIAKKFDDAAAGLPPVRLDRDLGRATSTICKALKARLLLYAASPLWNGSFPFPEWKNMNFQTPGYGNELVSHEYDEKKWDRAITACEEALKVAKDAGYELFDVNTANELAATQKLGLLYIPGREEETSENIAFKERVRMFQYLSYANESQGNKEIIWGVRISNETVNQGEESTIKPPSYVVTGKGTLYGGNAAEAPTLYTVQHFYTQNGLIPAKDPKFYPESEWYTRYHEGQVNTDNKSMPDRETVKYDIIKLNTQREARFYAWIAYDGCMYSPKIQDGKNPLWINFKNTNTNGYNRSRDRHYVGTGYLSKKFLDPNAEWYSSTRTHQWGCPRRPLVRMAELYMNLAECYAAKGETQKALNNLNVIRKRAGVKELTTTDLGDMSLMDWVRNERFVEFYEEGLRYYDLRRWTIAPERLKAGSFYGLNGRKVNPTFEDFNKPTLIDQPFAWYDRSYLLPVPQGVSEDGKNTTLNELYANPQMVQAPGY